jgi:uncharacterized protein YggE
MRKTIFAALIGLSSLLAASAAVAEGPIRLPQLAAGEVLLEVDGVGIVTTPASIAVVTATAYGYGRTIEEAQRRLAQDIERIRAAARAAGASDADISIAPVAVTDAIRMYDVASRIQAGDMAAAEGRIDVTADSASTVTIRLRNAAGGQELNDRLNPGGAYGRILAPTYELDDPAAARRQARAAALAQARADADAYAERVGMRVVRTLRVSDREGFDFLGTLFTDSNAMEYVWSLEPSYLYSGRPRRAEVRSAAVVGVDYVLAPR